MPANTRAHVACGSRHARQCHVDVNNFAAVYAVPDMPDHLFITC